MAEEKVVMPEKIGCIMHNVTRVRQKILSNPKDFYSRSACTRHTEGLLDSHCLILPRKKHWKSPEALRHHSWKTACQSVKDGME